MSASSAQIYATLKQLKNEAWIEFVAHANDPDGGQAYRNAYSDLDDAIDKLVDDAIAGRLADLTAELNDINGATTALDSALDNIQHDLNELARYVKIIQSATAFVATLRGGDVVAIGNAVQSVRNSFSV